LQLVKKFPAFHGTRKFITALTSVRHLSLSWASPIQSIYLHPTSRRSNLLLSTHLRLGLPSGLLPSSFPTKTLHTPPLLAHTHHDYCVLLTYLLTYSLTPRCRALLDKLTGLQLVKKFPAFHGTRRFITALPTVRHLSLSWASPIQSIYPHPTSYRSILILSTPLRLGLPSGLLPSGFPTKTLHTPPLLTHTRRDYCVLLTYLLTYLLHGAEPFLTS